MIVLYGMAGVIVLVALLAFLWPDRGKRWGRFEGRVVAHWHEDGRHMSLMEDFAYVDPFDKRWRAPKGSVVDGASIPSTFWSVIGGPFEGKYRNASVVHDVACDEKTQSWRAVHLAFYHACRCGGVDERKAKLMYYAVHRFGPRWSEGSKGFRPSGVAGGSESDLREPGPEEATLEDVRKAEKFFSANNPELDEIAELRIP